MEKKKYIKPDVEVIVTKVEQLLAAATPYDSHGGGNPGRTGDDPVSAKPVGSVGYGWYEEEESKGSSGHSLWD